MTSSLLLTENLALPLATGALCATVMVLREPGSRWFWVALGLGLPRRSRGYRWSS